MHGRRALPAPLLAAGIECVVDEALVVLEEGEEEEEPTTSFLLDSFDAAKVLLGSA